ncbi:hypothetical protein [Xanthomonas translucens]|uniref:Uncharacterized protein n=1 Tax=Xanthomonas translucens pv. translucens DSM 18974 TaxID=1261556 RepID=A0A1C3TTM9_XANCT|nr:hypothetical protein [Xanthomonas translucens]MCC8446374.1 hypothetical protein [Xanthomonas translucens pv. translucens]CCP39670.1 hypothetical protein BN444_01390 [Xanthomonas translucens pv. translucens DSM 18974]SCB06485.1 Conserved hypothetical protein [Xanthomonas translucens pv. translucens DSM 18974]
MKITTISATDVVGTLRFDSKFHLSRDNPILQDLRSAGWPMVTIAEVFGRENVWTGNIFARVYASDPNCGKPLLVPYDLFRYIPWSDKILSRTQVTQFEKLEIQRGWLFLVCSGRNLGPVTIADEFCERFTMSHDMVRIAVEPSAQLFYLAAFLSTSHGQAAVRTDMNGSVIDHTDAKQVAALRYPLVDEPTRERCANLFESAFLKREEARLKLSEARTEYAKLFDFDGLSASASRQRRYATARSLLADRLDAEPRAPYYEAVRSWLTARGGVRLNDVARVCKPGSRYKTNYVEDSAHGIRMMNGRQVAQYRPIALKLMNLSAFRDASQFKLKRGMTLLTADGRAEENLADCVMIAKDRDGWGASGHVHRVVPKNDTHPGLVYLACSSAPVQAQLKALATGSVVDALSESDVGSVVVPYGTTGRLVELGDQAVMCWDLFGEAIKLEEQATALLESKFSEGWQGPQN